MDAVIPPSQPILPATPTIERRAWYSWRRLGLNFLTLSVIVHLVFGLIATYFIVQYIPAKRRQTFAGQPAGASAPKEHKVQMQKQQQRASAPAAMKRVTTIGLSKTALPVLPDMPALSNPVTPANMVGMKGQGLGLGSGSTGLSGGGGSGGGGATLFGFHGASSNGLDGVFYDYKMDQGYQPIKHFDNNTFGTMVRTMLPVDGPWHPEQPYKHFLSPAKLRGRYFIFPAIEDTEAGAAFQSPRSGPGQWLAVYRGSFSSATSGSFRFVGFGDNVMIVQVGTHIVLDASDHGYTGQKREGLGNIAFPKKGSTPLFAGEWFNLGGGEPKEIAIAVGDEGGIFCSGLFVQPRNMTYAQGANGIPKLPVFMLGAATDADKQLLGKFLPLECLQGPFFQVSAPRSTGSSIFDH